MATFKDLQSANATISTTNIKGKEYAEVNQRIKAFRMVYPEGFINTLMLDDTDGVCKFCARVGYYNEAGATIILGTGHAFEKEQSSYINKTSYIENCETSAVGRALGMAGFGIDTSVASYEEVANAIKNQEKQQEAMVRPEEAEDLKKLMKSIKTKDGKTLNQKQYLEKRFGKENINELTFEQYLLAKDHLETAKAEIEKGEQK